MNKKSREKHLISNMIYFFLTDSLNFYRIINQTNKKQQQKENEYSVK